MISSYRAEEEFDAEIPANVSVVLIFEEDDVQVTVPGTAELAAHEMGFVVSAEAMQEVAGAQAVVTAALAHLDPNNVPPSELPPPSYEGPAHRLGDALTT